MLNIRKLSKISSNCSFILSDLQEVADEWKNELDDVKENEPEYDNQTDRWQERVDRLTYAIGIITETNEKFKQWINSFDNINPNSDNAEEDYDNLKYDLGEIIDDYVSAQSNKKGIAQYINKLKKVVSSM